MERKNTGMKMLNLEEFMQAQISDRVKAMRKTRTQETGQGKQAHCLLVIPWANPSGTRATRWRDQVQNTTGRN